ncbi:MAG: hypothetical protein LBF57_03150 [Holosporaceae bacterium]|jgi:hypothetical protein|nr:hypothetical protein [Holosporaceae bacterium]
MYIFRGENKERIFDKILDKNPAGIILDKSSISFSSERLQKCYVWDAYSALNCKKKILSSTEKAFLIFPDRIFKKSDFYIQKISFPEEFLSGETDIFLTEKVIAEFCKSLDVIDEKTQWLYAANHKSSGLRIIVGFGGSIILTRFLPQNSEIEKEISKTIIYLRRFDINGKIKIFTPFSKLQLAALTNSEIIHIEKYEDAEEAIADFLSKNRKIKPIYGKRFSFDDPRILTWSGIISVVFAGGIFYLKESIKENEHIITELRKDVTISAKHIKIIANSENFSFLKQFINEFKSSYNPVKMLQKISQPCREYNLNVEEISFSKGAKIKAFLSKKQLNELKENKGIKIEEISEDKYEEIGKNEKVGVLICID